MKAIAKNDSESPEKEVVIQCRNCKWFDKGTGHAGSVCRFNPPSVIDAEWRFPKVDPERDWCRRFEVA